MPEMQWFSAGPLVLRGRSAAWSPDGTAEPSMASSQWPQVRRLFHQKQRRTQLWAGCVAMVIGSLVSWRSLTGNETERR